MFEVLFVELPESVLFVELPESVLFVEFELGRLKSVTFLNNSITTSKEGMT